MKHPKIGDRVDIKFAGLNRTGSVVEISGAGSTKQWVVKARGIFYPCLTLDKSKMHHIIRYTADDIDSTRTCPTGS